MSFSTMVSLRRCRSTSSPSESSNFHFSTTSFDHILIDCHNEKYAYLMIENQTEYKWSAYFDYDRVDFPAMKTPH